MSPILEETLSEWVLVACTQRYFLAKMALGIEIPSAPNNPAVDLNPLYDLALSYNSISFITDKFIDYGTRENKGNRVSQKNTIS